MTSLTDISEQTMKPKYRWWQFSLRALMIFMLLIGVLFGWWAFVSREDGIIVDNDSEHVVLSGDFVESKQGNFFGKNFVHDNNVGKNSKEVTYSIPVSEPGDYNVFMIWPTGPDHASSVPVSIGHDGGISYVFIDQSVDGGKWIYLGTWHFSDYGEVNIDCDGTIGFVVADAVKLVRTGDNTDGGTDNGTDESSTTN